MNYLTTKKVLLSLALLTLTLGGCNQATKTVSTTSSSAYVSENGQIQVNLPSSWNKTQGLNEKADLQVANTSKNMFLIVLSESKEDFKKAGKELDLQKHSDITRGILLKNLTNGKESQPKSLTVNGKPAIQYEITGTVEKLNVAYLHTTVETDKNYQQILAYTSQDDFTKNRPEMEEVINSFQEVKK
jgi:cytochrome c biogenesis protein ResB